MASSRAGATVRFMGRDGSEATGAACFAIRLAPRSSTLFAESQGDRVERQSAEPGGEESEKALEKQFATQAEFDAKEAEAQAIRDRIEESGCE